MATLTYDPTEVQEGEFSAEEQEALKVGEALEEQQNSLLAGKFKDAEALEQGYIELQKKLGEPSETTSSEASNETEEVVDEQTTEDTESDGPNILTRLWEESQNEDDYSEDLIKELAEMNAGDLAQMYVEEKMKSSESTEQTTLSDKDVSQLKGAVGGDDTYDNMIGWASQNLKEQEIAMYDAVMDKGDPLAAYFAVKALQYRYNDAQGVDGELLTGAAPRNTADSYRSQAEVVRAMSDPRYETDPAYRQDVYNKLDRSKNLQF